MDAPEVSRRSSGRSQHGQTAAGRWIRCYPRKIVAQIMVCMSDYSGKRPCQTESRDASWILPPKSICLPMIRLPARRAMGWYRPSCPPSHA